MTMYQVLILALHTKYLPELSLLSHETVAVRVRFVSIWLGDRIQTFIEH